MVSAVKDYFGHLLGNLCLLGDRETRSILWRRYNQDVKVLCETMMIPFVYLLYGVRLSGDAKD